MKRLLAAILSVLLLWTTVLAVGAETETQPEPAYDEAAILDEIAKSWMRTCTENMKYCGLALIKYGVGRPKADCEDALRKDFLNNVKNGYTGTYAVQFTFDVNTLESYYGEGAIQTDLTTLLSTSGDAPLLSAERIAHDTAKSNLDDLISKGEFFGKTKLTDVIKENYGFILGEESCKEALESFALALATDNLDAKRQFMLNGAYLATFGCEMSIADADKLARPQGLTDEEILVKIVEEGINLVKEIVPQIGYTYEAIKISADIVIKTLSMQGKLDALTGFMLQPWTIEENWDDYFNALSNQYGPFTFNIKNGEVSLGKYNGYLLNMAEYAKVDIPETVYNAFPVVEFGKTFANGQDITEITIPSSIRTRRDSVVKNCDKLQTVNYNAKNCVADLHFGFFTDCDGDFSVNFGPGIETIPQLFIQRCGIRSIVFPEGVTTIYPGALYECPELLSVTIPSTVTDFKMSYG